jgi:hypothetical protein
MKKRLTSFHPVHPVNPVKTRRFNCMDAAQARIWAGDCGWFFHQFLLLLEGQRTKEAHEH